METNSNKRKSAQLGMPFGTACGKLRKLVLFDVLKRHGENVCHLCDSGIDTVGELSIEHKIAWLDTPDDSLFWDLDNIAFAHLSCNSGAARPHPKPKQRFCIRGHDTFATGRRKNSRCLVCEKEDDKGRRR